MIVSTGHSLGICERGEQLRFANTRPFSRRGTAQVAKAADVKVAAPPTPNTMTRKPFEQVFDPSEDPSDEALRDFCISGGCEESAGWELDVFSQLRNELMKGEATLGLDAGGRVMRVVSVAKPVRLPLRKSAVVLLARSSPAHVGCAHTDDLRWDKHAGRGFPVFPERQDEGQVHWNERKVQPIARVMPDCLRARLCRGAQGDCGSKRCVATDRSHECLACLACQPASR